MSKVISIQPEVDQEPDELTSYNNGIADGISIGRRAPWVRFDPNNHDTWPPVGVEFVGLWQYGDNWHNSECARIVSSDGAYVLEGTPVLTNRTWPTYWCAIPDPKDYAA